MGARAPAPVYSDLRRRLALVSVIVVLTGLWQTLRVSARSVTTLVIEVPATTHLLTKARPIGIAGRPRTVTTPTVAASPPADAVLAAGVAPRVASVATATAPVRGGASPPTTAPPTTAPPTTAPPTEVARPPALGVYDYHYTAGADATEGTITVSSPSNGEETETEVVAGATRERTLAWSGTAVTVVSSDYGAGRCEWSPALLAWQLRLRVGEQWVADSSCSNGTARVREQETAFVRGVARETTGGRPVQAWVIERHTVLTETAGNVVMTIESESSELFDAADGLILWEAGRTVTPNPDGTTTTTDSSMQLTGRAPD